MSQSFIVKGGKKLNGTLIPQGAKNEALQIISAVLLTAEEVTIANIPDIRDVNLLIEILKDLVNQLDGKLNFNVLGGANFSIEAVL